MSGEMRSPRKLSAAVSAITALSAWCAPCSGRNTSSYGPVGVMRFKSRPPCASCCERTEKSRLAQDDLGGLASGEDVEQLGISLPRARASRRARTMPLFSLGDLGPGFAQVLDVVDAHVRHHRHRRLHDRRGVPGPADPHLHDCDVDRLLGEPVERGGGEDLEVARPVLDELLDRATRLRAAASSCRRSARPAGPSAR